jgi:multidrug efflux pump subunit AcrB
MYLLGFSVNVVTLLALSLVIGILVDDAIVEVENIVRHLRMGKTPYQAAMEAADEIGLAVIATTFTLIAVFLPTAFMSGIPGKFFKQFGWTASLAVAASLLVARMLTPMMAAYILKPIVTAHQEPRWLQIYGRWATWCVRQGLHPSRRQLANPGLSGASSWQYPGANGANCRSGPPVDYPRAAHQERVHHHRWRSGRQ